MLAIRYSYLDHTRPPVQQGLGQSAFTSMPCKSRIELSRSRSQTGVRQGGGDEGLTRRYSSFKEYASEQHRSAKSGSNETLGVPIVGSPDGPEACMSIPVAIIMGVQVI